MTTLTPDYTPRSNTSKALLDQCGDVNAEIDGIEPSLEQLRILQHRALNDADNSSSSATNQQLDALSSETLVLYRELIKRVCTIKSNPEANDPKYKLSAGEIQCIMVHSGKKHVTCFVILALDELRESLLQNACSPCKEQSCRDAPGGALLLAKYVILKLVLQLHHAMRGWSKTEAKNEAADIAAVFAQSTSTKRSIELTRL